MMQRLLYNHDTSADIDVISRVGSVGGRQRCHINRFEDTYVYIAMNQKDQGKKICSIALGNILITRPKQYTPTVIYRVIT